MSATTSTIRPAADWQPVGEFRDVRYETAEGIAKITIDRPEVRNAFRPTTLFELLDAFEIARNDPEVGAIVSGLRFLAHRAIVAARRPAGKADAVFPRGAPGT